MFAALGVDVEWLGASPDGRNINLDCGSTHPEAMARRVCEIGAVAGVAFDGPSTLGGLPVYTLHAWTWLNNAHGIFTPHNEASTCG